MRIFKAVVFSLLVAVVWCKLDFPPGFKFGAATAAYQVEGAWNASGIPKWTHIKQFYELDSTNPNFVFAPSLRQEHLNPNSKQKMRVKLAAQVLSHSVAAGMYCKISQDKSESIWDVFSRRPGVVSDGSNGEVACDSYHQYKRDVEIGKELGLHFYRFSISWSRLLPNGLSNVISEDGKNYYNNLIDELLKNGIEPVVTLYHWDLPQGLQDLGGWTNPLIADWFADYARIAFKLFGDRVTTWLTINEAIMVCDLAYNSGMLAPGVKMPEAQYLCTKNIIMAHAKAWRIYDEEFRSQYKGQVSIANNLVWYEPFSESDRELTDLTMEYATCRYMQPIFSKEGGWPTILEKLIAEKSKKMGYARSRLPPFTEEEKKLVRGTYDFLAFNQYTSRMVRALKDGEVTSSKGWPVSKGSEELGIVFETGDWKTSPDGWIAIHPEGIRRQLNWLKEQYGDVRIMITENGYGDKTSGLDDDYRVDYYKKYLEQVLLAIVEDGVDVFGYTAWSLIDNFEWTDGYQTKFGLYEVDFEDPQRTRTPRKSAYFYHNVIKSNSLDVSPTYYN